MKYALPLMIGALALASCTQPADAPADPATSTEAPASVAEATDAAGITVTNPWCRTTPNGAKVAGCYVTLTSGADDTLTHVTTDAATMPQIHEMKHEDGMMKMAELKDGLALPAGKPAELKPHGNHLMLMGLKAPLVEGQTIKITLNFATAPAQTIDFAIITPEVVDSEE